MNHPAWSYEGPRAGTSRLPSALRPSGSTVELTSMAGIDSLEGRRSALMTTSDEDGSVVLLVARVRCAPDEDDEAASGCSELEEGGMSASEGISSGAGSKRDATPADASGICGIVPDPDPLAAAIEISPAAASKTQHAAAAVRRLRRVGFRFRTSALAVPTGAGQDQAPEPHHRHHGPCDQQQLVRSVGGTTTGLYSAHRKRAYLPTPGTVG